MRAPLPWKWSSRLPPCVPARPFDRSGPSVATPTTPTIGFAGKRTRSFMRISPSRTSKSRVTGDCTWSISCPKPGMSVATPHSMGRTSRMSTMSESPGSAPFTATGPVALLIRERSISVTRSSSLRICPVKQSFVSNVTVSPGSTSSTGWRSGPNDQITWSRDRRYSANALVLDVHTVDVSQTPRPEGHDQNRDCDSDRRVGDRHPVRVLERIRRRDLDEMVPEREEEQHDSADRQHDVQQQIELASRHPQVIGDAADADEHVHEHDQRHRQRRNDAEADAGIPLPADEQRDHERDARQPDDRNVRRLESRMRLPQRTRGEAISRECVEHPRRCVHRCVRVRRDRVADREEDDDPAGPPEHLAEVPPRVSACRLRHEVVEAGAEHPRVRAEHVEDADRECRADERTGNRASRMLCFLSERRGCLEADESKDRENHSLEEAAPGT